MPTTQRRPFWSDALTTPLAAITPPDRRPVALLAIKAIHTAAFAVIGGAILLFTWDGLTRRRGRRARVAAAIGIAESIVFASNNLVCPLTPLAEELGAERGSVTDIYLPDWISERVPLVGGSTLALGLVLHGTAWWRRSRPLLP